MASAEEGKHAVASEHATMKLGILFEAAAQQRTAVRALSRLEDWIAKMIGGFGLQKAVDSVLATKSEEERKRFGWPYMSRLTDQKGSVIGVAFETSSKHPAEEIPDISPDRLNMPPPPAEKIPANELKNIKVEFASKEPLKRPKSKRSSSRKPRPAGC